MVKLSLLPVIQELVTAPAIPELVQQTAEQQKPSQVPSETACRLHELIVRDRGQRARATRECVRQPRSAAKSTRNV